MYNFFPIGWCICQTIVDSMVGYKDEKCIHIPILTTLIWAREFTFLKEFGG